MVANHVTLCKSENAYTFNAVEDFRGDRKTALLSKRQVGLREVSGMKISNSLPSMTVKQLTKFNLFYKDSKVPGDLTYEICSKYVDDVVTVSDDEIAAAILALMEQHKLVTEGAGAVAVAAAMFGKVDLKGKKAVCLCSGGNIDVTILSRVIQRGLLMSGRTCLFKQP